MNISYSFVVIGSVFLAALAWVLTANIPTVFIVVLLSSAVCFFAHKAKKNQKDYAVLIERAEKLKAFSHKLQSLVNNELALVKDDVVRTRNIMSDSISILQASSLSIHATVISQNNELKAFEQIEGYAINQAQANGNIELMNGHQQLQQSQKIKSLTDNNNVMKVNAEQIIQALQFEDIVNQISERVGLHIDDIQLSTNILSNLSNTELSSTFDSDLDSMNKEYELVKEKLSNISSKKIAAQESMDEGDIDLF